MAVSKTSLFNLALIELGKPVILNPLEDTEAARLLNEIFDELLDEELADHNWTFATTRAQLPAESTGPDFGYEYSHVMPASPYCLHVISEENDYEYVAEGRKLLSDSTPLQIKYIYRITDYNQLHSKFRKAFIAKLASIIAIPLTGSAQLKVDMEKEYIARLQVAKNRDSSQNSPKDAVRDEDYNWKNARWSRLTR